MQVEENENVWFPSHRNSSAYVFAIQIQIHWFSWTFLVKSWKSCLLSDRGTRHFRCEVFKWRKLMMKSWQQMKRDSLRPDTVHRKYHSYQVYDAQQLFRINWHLGFWQSVWIVKSFRLSDHNHIQYIINALRRSQTLIYGWIVELTFIVHIQTFPMPMKLCIQWFQCLCRSNSKKFRYLCKDSLLHSRCIVICNMYGFH